MTAPFPVDNIIYIKGEDKKSETEPLKIWGTIVGDKILNAVGPVISA